MDREVSEDSSPGLSLVTSRANNIHAIPSCFSCGVPSPTPSQVAQTEGSPSRLAYHDMHDIVFDHVEKTGRAPKPHQDSLWQLPFDSSASVGFRFASEAAAAFSMPQSDISFSRQADQLSIFADATDLMSDSRMLSPGLHSQLPYDSNWSDEHGNPATLCTTGPQEEEQVGEQLSLAEDFMQSMPLTSVAMSSYRADDVTRLSMKEPRVDEEHAQNGHLPSRPGGKKEDIIQTLSALLSKLDHTKEESQDVRAWSFRMASETSNEFLNVLDRLSPKHKHDQGTTTPELDTSTTLLLIGCYIKLVPLLNKACKMLCQVTVESVRRAGTPSADAALLELPQLGTLCDNNGLKVFLFLQTIT